MTTAHSRSSGVLITSRCATSTAIADISGSAGCHDMSQHVVVIVTVVVVLTRETTWQLICTSGHTEEIGRPHSITHAVSKGNTN